MIYKNNFAVVLGASALVLGLQQGARAQSWSTTTGTLYTNPSSTKVGIGTSSPNKQLDVTGEINVGGSAAGISFCDRAQGGGYVNIPTSGQRFEWYDNLGTAKLWSGRDVFSVDCNGITKNISKGSYTATGATTQYPVSVAEADFDKILRASTSSSAPVALIPIAISNPGEFFIETIPNNPQGQENTDTYIEYVGGGGTSVISTDDDGGINKFSKLHWIALDAGTYWFRVRTLIPSSLGMQNVPFTDQRFYVHRVSSITP